MNTVLVRLSSVRANCKLDFVCLPMVEYVPLSIDTTHSSMCITQIICCVQFIRISIHLSDGACFKKCMVLKCAFSSFYAGFYSRNPLISLIRDKIVLQLQL